MKRIEGLDDHRVLSIRINGVDLTVQHGCVTLTAFTSENPDNIERIELTAEDWRNLEVFISSGLFSGPDSTRMLEAIQRVKFIWGAWVSGQFEFVGQFSEAEAPRPV